jgi:hypothetical protein
MRKTVASLTRLLNSPSGNPRWRVVFTDGSSYKTHRDAACNYDISQYHEDREVDVELATRLGDTEIIGWSVVEDEPPPRYRSRDIRSTR